MTVEVAITLGFQDAIVTIFLGDVVFLKRHDLPYTIMFMTLQL